MILSFIALVPVLYKLTFGRLPFEHLRYRNLIKRPIQAKELISIDFNDSANETVNKSILQIPESYIKQCIEESKQISERVFNRSGVYLLVGSLIAFIGVAIFYSPLFKSSATSEVTQRLLDYLPRFGSLFFIEFIAFFFLRQYRIMLEEYRYYEAVKRKRQDNFNIVDLIERYKDDTELLKIVIDKFTQTTITKLASGETTEILETQKIVNQDMDLFAKLNELMGV